MPEQRFGRIPVAVSRSGLSRGKLYQIAAKNPGLFRKVDSATIVDLPMLDRVLSEMPAAEIASNRAEEPAA